MIIEIHKPELENLIRERMASGEFQNVEDVLMQALKSSPAVEQPAAPPRRASRRRASASSFWNLRFVIRG